MVSPTFTSSALLMPEMMLAHSSWHLYPVLAETAEQANALNKFLNENKIGSTQNFYRLSLPEEKPLQSYEGEKAISKEHAARCFCLPLNPFLTELQVNEVCEKIRAFYSN